MKMYGFAYAMGFPCFCFGKKVWYFKLIWSPVKKKLMWYSWWSSSKSVWWQRVNSYPFRFFGLFILPNDELYDLEN